MVQIISKINVSQEKDTRNFFLKVIKCGIELDKKSLVSLY